MATPAHPTPKPTADQRSQYPQQLARALGMLENILITLSAVTPASSVFIIIPAILLAAGGASVSVLALAAVASVFVGFCYAELATAYPIAGGEYTWAARLLGRSSGFALFVLTLVNGVLIISVIALGTGDYLSVAIPSLGGKWVGVAVIAVTTVVALLNIKANAWVTGVFLCVEVSAIAVPVGLGAAHPERGPSAFVHAQTAAPNGLADIGFGGLATLIPVALFAYNGYGAAVYYAEETRNATRTIGRVIMICLAATVAIEVLPLAAVVAGAPSLTDLLHSDAPLNYFLTARGGSAVNTAVSVGIAIAIVNAVIAIILQIARLLFASARDRSWPDPIDRALGSVHPRLHTPVVSTIVVGLFAVLAAALLPMRWLIVATGAGLVLVYLFVALAALRIRAARRGIAGGYRMPLWPLPPAIVIGVMLYSAYNLARDDWQQIAFAVAAMVAGYAYYARSTFTLAAASAGRCPTRSTRNSETPVAPSSTRPGFGPRGYFVGAGVKGSLMVVKYWTAAAIATGAVTRIMPPTAPSAPMAAAPARQPTTAPGRKKNRPPIMPVASETPEPTAMPPSAQPTAAPPMPPTRVPMVAPMAMVSFMRFQAACSRS
ncbi:APC family permease [Nocardia sp. CDC153]|uniref:APC family permease n=1 Tax=Nocardia sp. CDC153 TaxID=3112167 RepID=UPI002DBAF28F|nr:APC family permease [Nocardia sp. CDC153]MEC3957103.1 APC family permease [Nocardia sp. CDC153]